RGAGLFGLRPKKRTPALRAGVPLPLRGSGGGSLRSPLADALRATANHSDGAPRCGARPGKPGRWPPLRSSHPQATLRAA
ncbi:hypothetical protein, partial [Streptomyces abikoensis]